MSERERPNVITLDAVLEDGAAKKAASSSRLKTPQEWTSALPSPVTVAQALELIKLALQDAEDAIMDLKGRGTVPPPPWPVHPELQKAIDSMEGGKNQLTFAVGLGKSDLSAKRGEPRWEQLSKGGAALYREIAVMQANVAKGLDLGQLAKSAVKIVNLPIIGPVASTTALLLGIGVVWYLERGRGRRRWVF